MRLIYKYRIESVSATEQPQVGGAANHAGRAALVAVQALDLDAFRRFRVLC